MASGREVNLDLNTITLDTINVTIPHFRFDLSLVKLPIVTENKVNLDAIFNTDTFKHALTQNSIFANLPLTQETKFLKKLERDIEQNESPIENPAADGFVLVGKPF